MANTSKKKTRINSIIKLVIIVVGVVVITSLKALNELKISVNTDLQSTSNNKKSTPLPEDGGYPKGQFDSWAYEPKNPTFFWKKMGDRPFQKEFYSRLGQFHRVLDVGARGYNRFCKEMINSPTTQYFQMEPNPPLASEMNNDGFLQCYMQEVIDKYPSMRNTFDLVIDFGVFGWEPLFNEFNENGVRRYVESVNFLLKDNGGIWALKIDQGWAPNKYAENHQQFFDSYILPYFTLGEFDNGTYKSGHSVKGGKFNFYFFYKK